MGRVRVGKQQPIRVDLAKQSNRFDFSFFFFFLAEMTFLPSDIRSKCGGKPPNGRPIAGL